MVYSTFCNYPGRTIIRGDCDDTNPEVHRGALEVAAEVGGARVARADGGEQRQGGGVVERVVAQELPLVGRIDGCGVPKRVDCPAFAIEMGIVGGKNDALGAEPRNREVDCLVRRIAAHYALPGEVLLCAKAQGAVVGPQISVGQVLV